MGFDTIEINLVQDIYQNRMIRHMMMAIRMRGIFIRMLIKMIRMVKGKG